MFLNREELEKKMKFFSQNAWNKRDTVSTVNHIIESMMVDFGDWLLREIETELSQKEYSDGKVGGLQKPERNQKSGIKASISDA